MSMTTDLTSSSKNDWFNFYDTDTDEEDTTPLKAEEPETLPGSEHLCHDKAFNEHIHRYAESVLMIVNKTLNKVGTGCLIGGDLLITNHHVICSPEEADQSKAKVWYLDQAAPDNSKGSVKWQNLDFDPGAYFFTCKNNIHKSALQPAAPNKLDFTIVALKHTPYLAQVQEACLSIFSSINPKPKSSVCVIHHPSQVDSETQIKRARQRSIGAISKVGGCTLHYDASAMGGSSGSPVIDRNGNFIGLHHQGENCSCSFKHSHSFAVCTSKIVEYLGSEKNKIEEHIAQTKETLIKIIPPEMTPTPPIVKLPKPPAPTQYFMGRDEDLKKLSELFESNNRVAITGLGGVGKTQLAYKFIQEQITCENAYFIDASSQEDTSSQESVKKALNNIAEHHNIPIFDYDKTRFLALKEYLNKFQSDFLMLVDNLDDQVDASWIKQYLPNAGRILITSRLNNAARLVEGKQHRLGNLSKEAAVSYLIKATADTTKEGKEAAALIARKLNRFPLALSHAAAYIQDACISLECYFHLLDDIELLNDSDVIPDDSGSINKRTVLATWQISLKKIKEKKPFAIDVMDFISVLKSVGFDLYFLNQWGKIDGHSKIKIISGIKMLCIYSFLNQVPSGDGAYTIHPLVQEVLRNELEQKYPKKARQLENRANQLIKELAIEKDQAQKLKPHQVANEITRTRAYIGLISGSSDQQEHIQQLYAFLSEETYYEPLRLACLEGLKHSSNDQALKTIASIPNKLTGYRYTHYHKYQELNECLKKMSVASSDEQHGSCLTGKLTTINWGQGLVPSPGQDSQTASPTSVYLKPDILKQILDSKILQGNSSEAPFIIKRPPTNQTSLHRVAEARIGQASLYFKGLPTHPCMEFAVTSFMYRLFGYGATPVTLARLALQLPPEQEEITIPVMLSLTVKGNPLSAHTSALDTTTLKFSEMLIAQLLLMPSDAHHSNFIISKQGEITCIDNEASFMPIKIPGSEEILFNSALFKQGNGQLHPGAIATFCKWDAHYIIAQWLKELLEVEKQWSSLFTENEKASLAKPITDPQDKTLDPRSRKPRDTNCILEAVLPEGTISRLYYQINHLQKFFKEHPNPTFKDLLSQAVTDQPKHVIGSLVAHYDKYLCDNPHQDPASSGHTVSCSTAWQQFNGGIPAREAIQKGDYSPQKALKELKAITQCIQPTDGYTPVPEVSRQLIILKLLQYDKAIKDLILPGFTVLDDKTLDQLLTKHQETIKTLDLRGRRNINFQSLKKLKKLSSLDISEATCDSIETLHRLKTLKANHITVKTPLKIKSSRLGYLELRGSRSSLEVDAPRLKYLDLSCNRTLKEIKLNTPKLEKLTALEYFADKLKSQVLQSCKITEIEWKFGAKKWAKYIGEVGEEPPLPEKLEELLKSPCPYWKGKQIKDTHMLTLIPATVNGKELTLERLGELVKTPKAGHAGYYRHWHPRGNEKAKADRPYWALMTKDVIPGTRREGYNKQRKLLKAGYEAPRLIEAAVSIFVAYVSEKEELYTEEDLPTYTRCQEVGSDSSWQMEVGASAGGGLDVRDDMRNYVSYGLAGVRKL